MGDNQEFKELNARTMIATVDWDSGAPFPLRKTVRLDPCTHGILTTEGYPHHEIHAGEHFLASKSIQADADDVLDVMFRIDIDGSTDNLKKIPHMTIEIESALAAQVDFYRNSGRSWNSNAGNIVESYNRNFFLYAATESIYTSPMSLMHTTSAGSEQTSERIIGPRFIGTSTGGFNRINVGGSAGGRNEFVLNPYEVYRVKVRSMVNSNVITIFLDWYEHAYQTAPPWDWPTAPEVPEG